MHGRDFGHARAPSQSKLPNVGTGQLRPLMWDLSHVPICPMNCERSVACIQVNDKSVIGLSSKATNTAYVVRRLCADDARGVVDCVRKVYGDSYLIHTEMYHPEQIVALNDSG